MKLTLILAMLFFGSTLNAHKDWQSDLVLATEKGCSGFPHRGTTYEKGFLNQVFPAPPNEQLDFTKV